jgi:hypothetical protein
MPKPNPASNAPQLLSKQVYNYIQKPLKAPQHFFYKFYASKSSSARLDRIAEQILLLVLFCEGNIPLFVLTSSFLIEKIFFSFRVGGGGGHCK